MFLFLLFQDGFRQLSLALNPGSSCLSPPRPGLTAMSYHAWSWSLTLTLTWGGHQPVTELHHSPWAHFLSGQLLGLRAHCPAHIPALPPGAEAAHPHTQLACGGRNLLEQEPCAALEAGPACPPGQGALTVRPTGGSTNAGHATETAQWEQYVPTEDREQVGEKAARGGTMTTKGTLCPNLVLKARMLL